jgi:tetratricopeptide (TPR) repeat protein
MKSEQGSSPASLVVGSLLILALLSSWTALRCEFVSDDVAFLVNNVNLDSLSDIPALYGRSMWRSAGAAGLGGELYRPLPLTLWCVLVSAGASEPVVFHGLNLLLHMLNTVLIWCLLRRLLDERLHAAWVGAGLFAVHPVHVEAIYWISAMSHVLGTSFFLASLLAMQRGVGARRRLGWLAASAGLALLGMLCQENCIGLPIVMAAYAGLCRRRDVVPYALWAGVAAGVYLLLRSQALDVSIPLDSTSAEGVVRALAYGAGYVKNLVLPWPQFLFLSGPDADYFEMLDYLLVLACILGMVLLWLRLPDRRGLVLLAGVWLVVTLLPAVAASLHASPRFAFRSLYLPSTGLCLALAQLPFDRWRLRRPKLDYLYGAVGLALIGVSLVAAEPWRNEGALFRRSAEQYPDSTQVHISLGQYCVRVGDERCALEAYRKAENHGEGPFLVEALDALGMLHGKKGELSTSRAYYRKVLDLQPDQASAWVGLGNLAMLKGDLQEAKRLYLVSLNHQWENYKAHVNLAQAYEALGDREGATKHMRMAEELRR